MYQNILFDDYSQMTKTYTITNIQGDKTIFDAKHIGEFIDQFEINTGNKFECVDLFWKNESLTSSLKFMKANLNNATELLMLVSDKPLRLMDKDIVEIKNNLSDRELEYGLWHSRSKMLEKKYGPVEDWDVSFIMNMNGWFGTRLGIDDIEKPNKDELFNKDITKWDVSSVRNFDSMFWENNVFNQDISLWNISSAVIMDNMFMNCEEFKQNLSSWEDKVSFIDLLKNIGNGDYTEQYGFSDDIKYDEWAFR